MGEVDPTKGTPEKATPDGKGQATPKENPQEQIDKAVQAALTKAGRDAKALETKAADLEAREQRIKEHERLRDQAELEAAKSDPVKLTAYQLKKDRELLEKEKAEHQAEITAAKETQREVLVWQVASDKGVDPMRLKNLSTEFNLQGKEQLEKLAAEIASKTEPSKIKTDSGVTSGARKDLSSLSPDEKLAKGFEDIKKK